MAPALHNSFALSLSSNYVPSSSSSLLRDFVFVVLIGFLCLLLPLLLLLCSSSLWDLSSRVVSGKHGRWPSWLPAFSRSGLWLNHLHAFHASTPRHAIIAQEPGAPTHYACAGCCSTQRHRSPAGPGDVSHRTLQPPSQAPGSNGLEMRQSLSLLRS